jgi:hypothetical protein
MSISDSQKILRVSVQLPAGFIMAKGWASFNVKLGLQRRATVNSARDTPLSLTPKYFFFLFAGVHFFL